ncbi:MAG: hypothetical protein QOE31_3596 [Solirubrobacteraceae bacterium]|jgi:hypothetical protein|nr:hypothetical protein [Solirubrobacteraceae bacterium]
MLSAMTGSLEISGAPSGLLDDDLLLRVRGAGPDASVTWRARLLDDDGRLWRAAASRAEELGTRWVPAKEGTGSIAALRSLRPVAIDVRAEAADGGAAARTITRRLAAEGVRTRRWRDGGLAARLHAPADAIACATLIVDATAGEPQLTVASLAAPLLASRGALVLVVGPTRGRATGTDPLATARERLAALPAAGDETLLLPALDPFDAGVAGAEGVVLPPGVGARDPQAAAAARAVAWDALLARLGARPRERAST